MTLNDISGIFISQVGTADDRELKRVEIVRPLVTCCSKLFVCMLRKFTSRNQSCTF